MLSKKSLKRVLVIIAIIAGTLGAAAGVAAADGSSWYSEPPPKPLT